MYATEEMSAELAKRGFERRDFIGGYFRAKDGVSQTIVYSWDDRNPKSLNPAPSEEVYWIASAWYSSLRDNLQLVVSAAERCPDPITCLVTAEVRGWKREV